MESESSWVYLQDVYQTTLVHPPLTNGSDGLGPAMSVEPAASSWDWDGGCCGLTGSSSARGFVAGLGECRFCRSRCWCGVGGGAGCGGVFGDLQAGCGVGGG